MRKSILLTGAIAVVAVGLALGLTQTEQGKSFLSRTFEKDQAATDVIAAEDVAAKAPFDATPVKEVADAETTAPATTESDSSATTEAAATDTASAGGMTPVDLDKVATATAQDATPVQETLNQEAPAAGETDLSSQGTLKIDIAAALEDRSIGSENAPVTVYDYSSLTCPHCAHFHNDVLPKIKENYIDTGKVRWVFHGFPLNEPALKAEMVARCAPKDQYVKLMDLMYQNQQRWAFEADPMASLNMFLRLAGITDDMFLSCINNEELQAALLKKYQEEGTKYKINSTPTFIFNDGQKSFSGAGSYEGFAFDLDAQLKAAAKKNAPETPAAK